MSQFIKPAKSNSELVQQWKERGLIIPDETRAERYLEHISYYRFSAYTIPFQQLGNTHINLSLIPNLMIFLIYIFSTVNYD
ncbi:hypothetical protein [Mannheimia indoligenes]|uniref:hypothetical protein n=1 Tax=Mannheimia indoligenes TaxID=3103145 RepID=UPI002FE51995